MGLIVETGAGLANANAFCSVAQATAYHAARDNTAWDAVAEPEAAIIKATDYMQQKFYSRWKGCRATAAQALDWPRFGIAIEGGYGYVNADIVPVEVVNACAELALRAASATDGLMPDEGAEIVSQTVGPISTTFAQGVSQSPSYNAVKGLLSRFLNGSNSIKVTRS